MARTYTPVGWQDGTVLQPAKVNVQGTEYNVEPQVVSGQTPVNATNLRKMDNEIKTIVEQDIPSVLDVNLIAVTDVAPTECSVGDKYYNTEDNKIYEAIDTNTWDTSGEYPIEGISYVVFDTQTSYAYNGTTLISVGGGSGSEIVIGDETEATEDTKLIIEEDDMNLDLQGSDFLNEYSESTEKGYACDYINDLVEEVYSTDEVKTNKVWIDGKPIYSKTINIPALANSASNTDYNHNISNVDSIWCDISHSFVKFSDDSVGNFQQVGALPNGGNINSVISIYSINTTKFTISIGTDRSSVSAWVTLEYTKTTD